MSQDWKQWEGQVVNGKFPLLRYLGGSEYSAVFLTEFHQNELPQRAAIKLIPAGEENNHYDEVQLSRWRAAAELSHPHLISIFGAGRCELSGVPLLFVVMECAEENLAQVLPSRALTPEEARETLDSVLDVLAYLHGKGFVHGHIKPHNIMADERDQLKLSSDGLRRAGEALERPGRLNEYDPPEYAPDAFATVDAASPAVDVWSLGMAIVETMTQTLVVTSSTEQREPLVPLTLPEPFLDIARHCLLRHPQERWTVSQIAARLQGRIPAPQVRALLRAPQSAVSRSSTLPAKRGSYGYPLAAGIVLALIAVVAGPRLLRRHSETPAAPATVIEQPAISSARKVEPKSEPQQVIQSQHERRSEASKPAVISKPGNMKEQIPEGRTPMPASAHPDSLRGEATDAVAMVPAAGMVHGEVAQKVLPEVLASARNTIRGTVKVTVNVDVDRSGKVEDAELGSHGPSKYFARAALQAAPLWRFKPPMVGGRGVLSTWALRFEFTRGGTTVVPTQEIP
jgi:TonB family protein